MRTPSPGPTELDDTDLLTRHLPDRPDPVRLDALTLHRRGLLLLDACSLTVEPGEILAIMGPSGAGKTTLLRTVAGLDAPSSGTVQRTPGRVATVFQDPRLLPWRTARANVEIVLDKGELGRAVHWLERVGLGDALDVFPAALSGGMRQRVAIARALASGAATVLVDEPFASLDADTAQRLRDLLVDELGALGRPVLWVTHNAAEAAAVSNRVLTLSGPPDGTWTLRDHAPATPAPAPIAQHNGKVRI
ncbi:MAG TPA: ABC transporter ATP-binding protein [Acidimicrobiales bacterium]|nr:ABC transporter ATP-binding protein [Acidimicrobiales bacterium]